MDYVNSATNTLTAGVQSLGQGIQNAKTSVATGLGEFSSKNVINASSEFLAANSMIAKFVFIVFVLILFMILFSLGSGLVAYLMSPTKTPRLINGKRGGSRFKQIPQDPAAGGAQIIYRSNNEQSGIEYTWELWLRVDGVRSKTTGLSDSEKEFSHIFHKGNAQYIASGQGTGKATTNNAPGLYVKHGENTLFFVQNVVSPVGGTISDDKEMEIKNIPLAKWFHLAVRLKNRVLDAYINGQIANRVIFKEVPKQNYDDVYICDGKFGGFNGDICDLRYFDRALSVFEINSIVSRGPNLAMNDDEEGDPGEYDYLSSAWYNDLWRTASV